MGGLIILVSILLTSLLYIRRYSELIPVLFMTLGFGIIGFLDDYIKVVMKRSLGLTVSPAGNFYMICKKQRRVRLDAALFFFQGVSPCS